VEIEAKFRLLEPSEDDLRRLQSTFGQAGYTVMNDPDLIHIVDTYFDRVDHVLNRVGAALRVRRENDQVLLTFKCKVSQEGALHARVELEAQPRPDHLRRVFEELEKLHLPLGRHQPQQFSGMQLDDLLRSWDLVAMLEISTERCSFNMGHQHRTLVHVVLDRVQFEHGNRQGGYSGIEIEAVGIENAEAVKALSEILKTEWGERIQEQKISKYEFALHYLGMGG
jgi:inorganic triphosphatase YgiF